MIVRIARDIDEAIKKNRLSVCFTHQGKALFGGDVDRVVLWYELGYGYAHSADRLICFARHTLTSEPFM